MARYSITKTLVNETNEPGIYREAKLPGFVLRIRPSGKKFYAVMRKVRGSQTNVTITIGFVQTISAEEARIKARDIIAQMSSGINPNETSKKERDAKDRALAKQSEIQRVATITLGKVAGDYLSKRPLKDNTRYIYQLLVNRYLADWLDKPITEISKDMVAKKHAELSEHKAQANYIMRILRAFLSYAAVAYEDADGKPIITENPVCRLSLTKSWHRVSRRQSVIKSYQLKNWYSAVVGLEEQAVADYLLTLLLTGLRKNEAALLKWPDVDFKGKTLLVRDTKNREDHMLPLSPFLYRLLLRRWDARGDHKFVFYMDNAKRRVYDCRAQLQQVENIAEVSFMLHDLRRTFLTIAEELDTPHYALKRLANHKTANDVTAGYIVADVERLRQPMDRINAQILLRCGVKQSAAHSKQPRGIRITAMGE